MGVISKWKMDMSALFLELINRALSQWTSHGALLFHKVVYVITQVSSSDEQSIKDTVVVQYTINQISNITIISIKYECLNKMKTKRILSL